MYSKTLYAGWADMDFNGHMKKTAYLGKAADGSRFILRHEIFRPDGKRAARVSSLGGWLDLAARRLVAPPPALFTAMESLAKSDDFVILPSSIRERP